MSMAEQQAATVKPEDAAIEEKMRGILERQRKSFLNDGPPALGLRIDRIQRAIDAVIKHQNEICEALSADFGHRSADQTMITDVFGSIEPLKFARKHVKSWMKAEKRKANFPFNLVGSKARVEYQPKGVVGVISPWNFPVNLTFAPLAGVFAAGNRVMIKPSEYTPATSELMTRMISGAFDETEAAVITGGPAVGEAFSQMPFDHLLFTGATSIARHVMRAASENLVPVTLELGGKSPVILGRTAKMEQAVDRIMTGKMLNAGQICLAPDYVFVPEENVDTFVTTAQKSVTRMYPTLKENSDYTSVINQRHFDRLQGYLDDAREKGGRLVEINPADEDFSQQPANKMPPTLVLDPSDDMTVMQEEIFGPVLPVKSYRTIDEVIDYVNDRARPLGLYYFGGDGAEEDRVLTRTTSGGVTVNDVIFHVSQEDLPFGGVGPSGMGAYHGIDGFRTFSHAKAVYRQETRLDLTRMFRPPYTDKLRKTLKSQIKP